MTNSTQLEQEWLNHIESEVPRYIGFPRREVVYTLERYLFLIWRHLYLSPIHVGVYSERQRRLGEYNKLYLDLDHDEDLDIVWIDTMTLREYYMKHFGREPRIYFSGKKGFHVYLDFHPYAFKVADFQNTFKVFVEQIVDETGITTIDTHCIEPNRIARLPYTPHLRGKKWCIPIHHTWSLKKILKEATHLDQCFDTDVDISQGDMRIIDNLKECEGKSQKRKETPIQYPALDHQSLSDEIQILSKMAPFVEDGRHRILHFMIVPRLLQQGLNLDEILSYCHDWIRTSGEYPHKYVPYIERSFDRNRHWNPWSFNKFFYEYPFMARHLSHILKEEKNNEK